MRRFDYQDAITFSVLDRLLDSAPVEWSGNNLELFKESVVRDLQWLLNTRQQQQIGGEAEGLDEVPTSITAYGLPDLSSLNDGQGLDHERVRDAIEEVVRIFEPRLRNVSVEALKHNTHESDLRFRIDATLLVTPSPEFVSFDTTLNLSSGEYTVQEK